MIEDIRYPKKLNWPLLLVLIALMIALLLIFDLAAAEERDPGAVAIAQRTMDAMGGVDAWKSVSAIRFNFVVETKDGRRSIKHLWDRKNNRDHVEGPSKDGKPMVAWVDLGTRKGAAWKDGKALEGEELQAALKWAYGRWVNDTYWFTMPWKLMDNGVKLKSEGAKNGFDVLLVSFENVGLTPGDQYRAFINRETGLMERWEFTLEDGEKGSFAWKEWSKLGPVQVSKMKPSTEGDFTIRFDPMEALESADPAYFSEELKTLD